MKEMKCKVVLLPTEKATRIINDRKLEFIDKAQVAKTINSDVEGFELFILSDEEGGDWCKHVLDNCVHQWNSSESFDQNQYSKVIATTDSSLITEVKVQPYHTDPVKFNLARPSDDFIKKYCEKYNKGEIIEEVLVELEYDLPTNIENTSINKVGKKIKVAPDNTITIHPVVEGNFS